MSGLGVGEATDFELILDEQQFEAEPCAFPCDNEAGWYVLCGICRAAEPCCNMHHDWIIETWTPDMNLSFDTTCKHNPEIQFCIWEKI